jgi:hypothetical protein
MTSATLMFDTLRYANKLKAAGVPEKQAEVQAETLAEIVDEKLATKQDLEILKKDIIIKITFILGSMMVGCFGILATLIVIFQK